jgi:hypothetical protein
MILLTEKFLIENNINVKKNILQRKIRKDKALREELNIIIKVNEYNINLLIKEEHLQYLKDYFSK